MNAIPLSKSFVLSLHRQQIHLFGGLEGTNNDPLLDSALTQPFASFGGVDLYPTIEEKAARYAFGIIKNHPFADGNKRTGAATLVTFLKINGFSFRPNHKEFETVIIEVASGEKSFEDLVRFISITVLPEVR